MSLRSALAPFAAPRRWRVLLGVLLAAALLAGAGVGGHRIGYASGLAALRSDIDHRLDLFAATALGLVNRLEHVPATIQLNREVVALFREPASPARVAEVNDFLYRLNAHQRSQAVFVVDQRGIVIASSNPDRPDDSRLGEDLSYRPYYVDALSGRVGRHFAIGTALEEPGYFFSHPIRDGARVVGVAVTKIALAPIDEAFPLLGTPALIADRNQIVILSSRPEWRYTSMKPLTVDSRVDLELTGMYGEHRIGDFPLGVDLALDDDTPSLDRVIEAGSPADPAHRRDQLVQGRTLDGMDWRLLVFSDLAPVRYRARVAAALSSLAAAFAIVTLLYLLQRRRIARQKLEAKLALERVNAELERTVEKRTQALTDTNRELRREMSERIQAEATLRAAQDDLVQAAKLAVLGQLATGITHELAQPLGAIRALAGNAREFLRRADEEAAHGNLAIIDDLVDRMGGIIHPLKAFARKSPVAPEATNVNAAIDSALFLLDQRVRSERVEVVRAPAGAPVTAWCNRNRLEQVLINVIGNAIDAMHDAPRRELFVAAETVDGSRVRIEIADSGAGMPDEVLGQLFTPFFTTKAAGSGLGLGLAISRGIAQDYGGDLAAENRAEGGARFTLWLPAGPAIAPAPAAAAEAAATPGASASAPSPGHATGPAPPPAPPAGPPPTPPATPFATQPATP